MLVRARRWACFATFLLVETVVLIGCSSPTTPTPPPPTPDPPSISCPSAVTQISPTGQPQTVLYGGSTTTNGVAPVTVSCTPASGSTFPLGTSTVTCAATDARQRTASCSFPVVLQMPARIGATRFLAFGDSITLGEDGNDPTLAARPSGVDDRAFPTIVLFGQQYPTVLEQSLAARYTMQTIFLANAAQRGEFASDPSTVARFVNLLGQTQAQVALIMEGTNDVFDGTPSKIGPAIAGLRSMVQAARLRSVRPYLATVPPMNPNGRRGRLGYATIPLLNAEIIALARSEGATLVDVNQAFAGNLALLSADGLHPNAEGFALIAKTFFDRIVATLETSPPTWRAWPQTPSR